MEQILIEVDTLQDKELLLALLPSLNSRVVSSITPEAKAQKSTVEILKQIASRGGVTSFGDASEGQRETRSDRPLAHREE